MPHKSTPPHDGRLTGLMHTLRRCVMFRDLSSPDIEAIAEICILKGYDKGQYVFRRNENVRGFFVVQSGSVNVHQIGPDGREQVIAIFLPGDSFAEVALSDAVQCYPADATALESSQIILVPRKEFRERVRENPDLAFRMLTSMSIHLKQLVQKIEDLKHKHIEARLAHWLIGRIPPTSPGPVPCVSLPTSKRVLASDLGVASETLSRTLARFRDEGLIEVEGPEIRLLDLPGLRRYIDA